MAGAAFHSHITANATEEFKIVRPFGDNGNEAENWSVNLLHPYPGNVSLIGDCLKLRALPIEEGKAVAVIGYEHSPPRIGLAPLVRSFELLGAHVAGIKLGPRIEISRKGLIHPIIRWREIGQDGMAIGTMLTAAARGRQLVVSVLRVLKREQTTYLRRR